MTARIATIVSDVTGLQQRHHPWNIPHLVKKIKGFPVKVKSFLNTAKYQKILGEVSSPPCTTVAGYEFACASEGYYVYSSESFISFWQNYCLTSPHELTNFHILAWFNLKQFEAVRNKYLWRITLKLLQKRFALGYLTSENKHDISDDKIKQT